MYLGIELALRPWCQQLTWARHYFKEHPIPEGDLDDMREALSARLPASADFVNENYDVQGLRKQFRTRFQELGRLEGERLTHH